ncbi:NYN domain-containing protein [Phreatobacter oligotrophus]|nr:NYN domain-containing protein [Phreatobacter oligotrophus]
MIDGGFFLKRIRYQFPEIDAANPKIVANLIHGHALRHRYQLTGTDQNRKPIFELFDLYRVFFYDCPPLEKKMHRPVTKSAIDFAKTPEAVFRNQLHFELRRKRKVALRLGHLIDTVNWRLKPSVLPKLLRKEISFDSLTDDDFSIDTSQKGVDMRLGLDVAALSYKKLVDQIVMVVGDSDFVPAAKLARREGIDVIIDPLGQTIHDHLFEHTDGVRTPKRAAPPRRTTGEAARPLEVAPSIDPDNAADDVGPAD